MASVWVDLMGSEVRYRGNAYRTRTIEAGSGEVLILIHGVGGHAEAYSRNIMRLAERFHVVAIDLLWHGYSDRSNYTPRMVPEYAKQVVDLIDSLGVQRASIEGESLGGWVAMYVGLHYPDRVNKLILNTAAGVQWKPGTVDMHPETGVNLLRERSLQAIHDPNLDTVRKRMEWLMASPDRVTDEIVDIRHKIYNDPGANAALTQVFENSFGAGAHDQIAEEELAKLTAPSLVLWTDKNPGAGPDAGERLAKAIPGAQFYCIMDAAHWPQWEQPEEHDRVVTGFLTGETIGAQVGAGSAVSSASA
jgi:pimeloyl-ACP methyl ester carboxylesterase